MASGAIVGHLVATTIAILGGAFLANYISEKLVRPKSQNAHMHIDIIEEYCILVRLYLIGDSDQVGYLGGALFIVFAIATFFGVF